MAQAARLSMRMQKEMKLLLSDPPHGASFPHLSSASAGSDNVSNFFTIDALIEGPEDTVYANGIFSVKIQIPERYPFQPPIVAFATPIYHPSIDNSGRICLDILNLPPKGAWQPSLNILKVLMSIRLLLSDPNPDDGLMCEVSREYKNNRQTFDFKAREMTEKYAKVKADGRSTSLQNKNHGDEKVSECGDAVLVSNEDTTKLKLTMDSSKRITDTATCETSAKDIPNNRQLLQSNSGNRKRKSVIGVCEANTSGNDTIKTSRKKSSLALPPQPRKKDSCSEELTNGVSVVCKEIDKQQSDKKKCFLGMKRPYNVNLASSSFRIPAAKSNNNNNRLGQNLSLRPFAELNEASKTDVVLQTDMSLEENQNGDAKTSMPESVVVADSDDSGEEEKAVSLRSRLSLTRRRGLKTLKIDDNSFVVSLG